MRTSSVLAVLALAAVGAAPAGAQNGGGLSPAVGLGLGSGSMTVGGRSGSTTGITLNAGLGPFEVEFQPFSVPNPAGGEQFRSLYILIGPRIRLSKPVYIRPAIGLQLRSWSGSNPVTSNDQGIAIGVLAAYQLPLASSWTLTPEVAGRWAVIELKGNVTARLVGLRVQFSRRM
jgi:hypothetical protein